MPTRIRMAMIGIALATSARLSAQRPAQAGQFVPEVEHPDTVAKCETLPDAMLAPDERGFLLRYESTNGIDRVVSAVWDTTGRLRRYSDARGDLRGLPTPIAERGPRTTIGIDLVKGFALLDNENHGRSQVSMATVGDAMSASRLGPPNKLLERLHTQCGAPANPG